MNELLARLEAQAVEITALKKELVEAQDALVRADKALEGPRPPPEMGFRLDTMETYQAIIDREALSHAQRHSKGAFAQLLGHSLDALMAEASALVDISGDENGIRLSLRGEKPWRKLTSVAPQVQLVDFFLKQYRGGR